MSKTSPVESFKQINSFQTLRKSLLQNKSASDLEKPLAYWALPGDRRLPLAFLGHSLRDLLNLSFEELAATPGIGQKKIGSLLKLLSRAVKKKISADPLPSGEPTFETERFSARNPRADFDADLVSESLWEQWRETVRRHGLESEKLGRLAPSLQELPTVIWGMPLSEYLGYTVAEMRQLKTHGEKRVRVILEVFHSIHTVLGASSLAGHLSVHMVPKFVVPLEIWVAACLDMAEGPSNASVRQSLAIPLLQQVQIDCGQTIARLAEGRLGIHSAAQSVKLQSKKMSVTRARIYQLLEECQQAMALRWPNGRFLLTLLVKKLAPIHPVPEGFPLLQAITDLFFPDDEELSRRKKVV
jgi:hypothetical protein